MDYHDIVTFWFEELEPADHFRKSAAVDAAITKRFTDVHQAVMAGEHKDWRATPEGSLAEIIVLDQFSRNLFRDDPRAYAHDEAALALAKVAIAKGYDQELEPYHRLFMYLPYMHSESKVVHEDAVPLFESLGLDEPLKYEHIHKEIIDRFGRYPHRNEVLGRPSTPEETAYLAATAEAFF